MEVREGRQWGPCVGRSGGDASERTGYAEESLQVRKQQTQAPHAHTYMNRACVCVCVCVCVHNPYRVAVETRVALETTAALETRVALAVSSGNSHRCDGNNNTMGVYEEEFSAPSMT